ncbi:MAG: hypothetical protein AAFX56_17725 [Pseudomonadota bacterium]
MRSLRSVPLLYFLVLCLALLLPGVSPAGVSSGDFPEDSSWYFHADLKEMRRAEGGRDLHAWLDREVFEDLRDDLGIDFAREADRVTAFSSGESGVAFVLEGPIETSSKDKLMSLAADAEQFESYQHKGREYHFVRGEFESDSGKIEVDNLDDGAYFSFAQKNMLLISSSAEQMQALLDQRGRVPGQRGHGNALLVLSAERSLVQAGAQTGEFAGDDDDGWDSNFLKNAEQVALLVADADGNIAVEAQMVTVSSEKAEALANVARGVLALQAFSEDMEPHVRDILANTRIDVDDTVLKVNVALDPAIVIATLED